MTDTTIDDMFPSRFYKAADLPRKGLTLTLDAVEKEKLGDDEKWVAYFVETDSKALVLNKTNATVIADAFGRKVADWIGRSIHLRKERVRGPNGMCDAIRVSAIENDLDDEAEAVGAGEAA